MKVFIIGIAGGVGRRLAERLASTGDEPNGLVRRKEQEEALASSGVDLGLARVHTGIARDDVAASTVVLLRTPGLCRTILELNRGGTAISEGIDALATDRAAAA